MCISLMQVTTSLVTTKPIAGDLVNLQVIQKAVFRQIAICWDRWGSVGHVAPFVAPKETSSPFARQSERGVPGRSRVLNRGIDLANPASQVGVTQEGVDQRP